MPTSAALDTPTSRPVKLVVPFFTEAIEKLALFTETPSPPVDWMAS